MAAWLDYRTVALGFAPPAHTGVDPLGIVAWSAVRDAAMPGKPAVLVMPQDFNASPYVLRVIIRGAADQRAMIEPRDLPALRDWFPSMKPVPSACEFDNDPMLTFALVSVRPKDGEPTIPALLRESRYAA